MNSLGLMMKKNRLFFLIILLGSTLIPGDIMASNSSDGNQQESFSGKGVFST